MYCHGKSNFIVLIIIKIMPNPLLLSLLVGKCGDFGTKGRTSIGECFCKEKFTGPRCTECIEGYMGSDCSICNFGFHMADNKCLNGDCDIVGTETRENDGTCICKLRFDGFQCNECFASYNGSNCDNCATGFHYVEGNCFGMCKE